MEAIGFLAIARETPSVWRGSRDYFFFLSTEDASPLSYAPIQLRPNELHCGGTPNLVLLRAPRSMGHDPVSGFIAQQRNIVLADGTATARPATDSRAAR